MPFCIPGSRIPLTRQTRFLVGRALFGSVSISITWFEINLLFEESRSTFRTIPKEPGCSTGLGSKSFRSPFCTAGLRPASFSFFHFVPSFLYRRHFVPPASSRLLSLVAATLRRRLLFLATSHSPLVGLRRYIASLAGLAVMYCSACYQSGGLHGITSSLFFRKQP